jgi:hypothetical protein
VPLVRATPVTVIGSIGGAGGTSAAAVHPWGKARKNNSSMDITKRPFFNFLFIIDLQIYVNNKKKKTIQPVQAEQSVVLKINFTAFGPRIDSEFDQSLPAT